VALLARRRDSTTPCHTAQTAAPGGWYQQVNI